MLDVDEVLARLNKKKNDNLINETTYNKYSTVIKYFKGLEPTQVPNEYRNSTYYNYYIIALKSLGYDYIQCYNKALEKEISLKKKQEIRIYPSYLTLLDYLRKNTISLITPERYTAIKMTWVIAINGIRQSTMTRPPLYRVKYENTKIGIKGEIVITYIKRNKCYFFIPQDMIQEIPYKDTHLTYHREFMTQLRKHFNITWDAHEIFRHALIEFNKQTLENLSVLAFDKWRVLIGHEVNRDVVKYYLDNDGARLEFAKQYYDYHLNRIQDYVRRWC